MNNSIRPFQESDIPQMTAIWNSVVAAGKAFPQEEFLNEQTAADFFSAQTLTAVAVNGSEPVTECDGEKTGAEKCSTIAGLYILHPNNIGRCGHIANSSYAVSENFRGQKIGEMLVRHSLKAANELGFRILQFNAVAADNTAALALYKKIGFTQLGIIPGGFRRDSETGAQYIDIIPHYIAL